MGFINKPTYNGGAPPCKSCTPKIISWPMFLIGKWRFARENHPSNYTSHSSIETHGDLGIHHFKTEHEGYMWRNGLYSIVVPWKWACWIMLDHFWGTVSSFCWDKPVNVRMLFIFVAIPRWCLGFGAIVDGALRFMVESQVFVNSNPCFFYSLFPAKFKIPAIRLWVKTLVT
jgi:hypothetical protein